MEVTSQSIPSVHEQLCFAIKYKRLIRFHYQGYDRIGEPHDYGVLKDHVTVLFYQTKGGSKTGKMGWKYMNVGEIRQLQVLDDSFPGGRPVPSGKHKNWDQLFIRVDPAA